MRQIKRLTRALVSLLILTASPMFLAFRTVSATPLITFRSVTTSSAIPGATMSETFNFSLVSVSPIGSIVFEHCSNSPLPQVACVAPAGYSSSSRNLTAQTNNTGFLVDSINSTVNKIVISRAPAAANLGTTTYGFTNITNATTAGQTVYVRISTYASIDGTGAPIDAGSMAFATQAGFSVGAFVPPFLIFCVGITVGNQCTSATGSLISFGELSTTQVKSATSQFSGATNDFGGYTVFVDGHTMTAGNQAITALASGGGSQPGTSQFGFNMRGNTVPSVGADQTGVGTSVIAANYNTPNVYRMVTGDLLTSSSLATDYNITTVSYIVNISSAQPPGYYATTLTFIAVAAF